MAQPTTPVSIIAPGYYGLNTQDSPVDMDDKYALAAINCVIDQYGRIGSRKGWVKANTTNSDLGTSNITCIGEVVQNDGTKTTIAAGGGFLFKLSGTTLTTLTYGGGGAAPTISDNNWQFCQLNGIGILFQRGYDPLIFDPVVSTTTFRRLSEKTGYAGTVPQANCAISAYGRIWCADTSTDKHTVTFSDIITPQVWTGGTSGTLNLLGVWPQGSSQIVALASHNNFLFIFGTKQVLVYSGASTPSTMVLSDTLTNIGCVARDSVQNTGSDVVFLSDDGVRSLGRTIQEKSAPLGTWSRNVHNDIEAHITAETGNIRGIYCIDETFYLLTFPTSKITYCFDTLNPLPDGSMRVTTWDGTPSTSFFYTQTRKLYLGKPGYIGQYSGYLDDTATYRMYYYTTWKDLGNPIQTSILKKLIITLLGAKTQNVVFKWGFDFVGLQYAATVTITSLASVSEWGTAEWGLAEWQGSLVVTPTTAHGQGVGRVLQIGFETNVNGTQLSIQKIDIFTKEGSLRA